jgi:hypothetical protein
VRFPELPILDSSVAAPARGQREKYGALYYLGIGGLLLLVALVGWFGFGLWSNRDIWADVYILSDPNRSEPKRIEAAARLGQNPRFADRQKMEMSLRKDLPDPGRYLLAEGISTEIVAHDPRAYALAVARSPGWPDWLRLLLARRLAYGAGRGYAIPREALDELARHSDPMIGLWATYALAMLPRSSPDPTVVAELQKAAEAKNPEGELAGLLVTALRGPPAQGEQQLDEATMWLRGHHPQARKIWQGTKEPRP